MFSRLAATIAAGVLVGAGLATSTANAAAVPITDTIRVSNYLDNGAGGYWAWRNFARTTTITKVVDAPEQEADTYLVRVVDRGDLRTIKGAKSPNGAVPIARSVRGSATGWYESQVKSVSEPTKAGVTPFVNARCSFGDGQAPRLGDCPGLTYETHDWWQRYFPQGAQDAGNASYRWDYVAGCERWTDPNGTTDITGARCDRTVRADAPTAKDPACDTSRGTLTVPSDRGVYYRVNGKVWRAGDHEVRPGRYVVTAHARDGYRLVGDRVWRRVVERAEACPSPSPSPTVTPTVTSSPTPTGQPSEGVTPEAPELTQATCDAKATVTIPEQDGVVFKNVSGTVLEQGKPYSVDPGPVTVKFEAADGYELAEGAKTEWKDNVAEAPTDCEPAATPTVTTPTVTVVNNIPVPSRVDTGLGGLVR